MVLEAASGKPDHLILHILEGVYAIIREMAAQFPDVAGLGVTSFGETFVLTDGEGTPLHPAMLYTQAEKSSLSIPAASSIRSLQSSLQMSNAMVLDASE